MSCQRQQRIYMMFCFGLHPTVGRRHDQTRRSTNKEINNRNSKYYGCLMGCLTSVWHGMIANRSGTFWESKRHPKQKREWGKPTSGIIEESRKRTTQIILSRIYHLTQKWRISWSVLGEGEVECVMYVLLSDVHCKSAISQNSFVVTYWLVLERDRAQRR